MKVIASVTSDPKLTFERVRGSNINPSQSSFLVRTSYLESQKASYEVRLALRVLIPKKVEFIPGDLVEFQGRLINSKERRVAALLIADEEFLQLSKVGALGQLLAEIRSKFRNQAAAYESNSGGANSWNDLGGYLASKRGIYSADAPLGPCPSNCS